MMYFSNPRRHITVQIAGKCGSGVTAHTVCPPSDLCESMFNSHYFYIAAENAICKDYITEKYWQRYHLNAVPIVMRRHVYEG